MENTTKQTTPSIVAPDSGPKSKVPHTVRQADAGLRVVIIAVLVLVLSAGAFVVYELGDILFGPQALGQTRAAPTAPSGDSTLQCSLNGSSTSAEVDLAAPAQGQLDLYVICPTARAPFKAKVNLTQFEGEGVSVPVELLLPPDYKAAKSQTIDFTPPVADLRLAVHNFPALGKYWGLLAVTPQGKDTMVWRITLSHVAPLATLVVSHPATLQVTRPFLWWHPPENPVVDVGLWEKSGQASLGGIYVRLEQVTKQPGGGFSLSRNVDFTFKGQPVLDFETLPSQSVEGRSIAAGSAVVGMKFKHLHVGEYNAVLSLHALNSLPDDSQRVNLVIQVRDSVWWAALLLVAAVGLSFVAFKVSSSLYHRYNFLQQLKDLRPEWLAGEPSVLAVVWVKAALKQTEDLSNRFWLTGADQVDARIARLKSTVAILGQIRATRLKLEDAVLPRLIRIRAMANLHRIVSRLGDAGLDDAALANLNTELTAFGAWLNPGADQENCYWTDLCGAIRILLDEISLVSIPFAVAKAKMAALYDAINAEIDPAHTPANLDAKMAVERQYAALKILWERRAAPELKGLADLIPAAPLVDDPTLKDMFALADDYACERIMTSEIEIKAPPSDAPDPLLAYEPLHFEVCAKDPALNGTYVFQHGLQFNWSLTFTYKKAWLKIPVGRKTLSLTPVSDEPRVVQYVPRAGRLAGTVEVQRDGKTLCVSPEIAPAMEIGPSSDFGIFRGLARVEWVSWVVAAMMAVISGVATFYYKGQTFGSFQDYLSLFAWGAGVDQGKNFLQTLQAYSPSRPAAS